MKRIILIIFLFSSVGLVNGQKITNQSTGEVIYPTEFHVTPPLRDLVKLNPIDPNKDFGGIESPDRTHRPPQSFPYAVAGDPQYGDDPSVWQTQMGTRSTGTKGIIKNWAGQVATGFRPMDPTGAAGPNHYVQAINGTPFRVLDKNTGTALLTASIGSLWSPALSDDGDPIIMYDKYADRWFLSQFGITGNKIYIAISTTNDPTGSYYTYTYTSPQFPDYLKFSIWENGYYMTSNQSTDRVFCFERTEMLAGNPSARSISQTFTTGTVSAFFCPLPADASDANSLPDAGTPLPFVAYYDNGWGGGTDGVKIWNMTVTWGATPTATIAAAVQVNTSAFDATYDASWNDVTQPGTTQKLDGIGGVPTFRAQWTKWTGYNSLVMNWGIKLSATQRSIRWVELRQNQSTGTWSLYQEGTYTPDADTRWMGSIAMDVNGSIGLAYCKSSSSTYPTLCFTGRLAGDPLGTMNFTETVAATGTSSQTGTNRYGDYSHTALDPDGITFWHTGEYIASGVKTRIFSFQLPAGNLPPVANFSANPTTTTCSGFVQFTDLSSNTPTSWLWNFGDGQTSTLQNPSHTYTTGGTYTVALTATNAYGNNQMIKTNYLTINIPNAPTATGGSRCGTGTVNLSATGSGILHWFDAATGGTDLGTGTAFTTPVISTTTTYYVENHIVQPPLNVGPVYPGGGATNTAQSWEIFDCYTACKLVSVSVNAASAGNRLIELKNSGGTTLQSATVNIPAGASRITLNFDIPVGTGLQLVAPANCGLYRLNSGVTYPYTLSGVISITNSNAGTSYYYYFYDWEIQLPDCISSRVPAVATVNTASVPAVSISASATTICSGTNVTFTATPTNGGTPPTYQWQLNGTNVGTNLATYANSTLANGNTVSCIMTSSLACVAPISDTSNIITMTVNTVPAQPSSITGSTTPCQGSTQVYSVTNVSGVTYTWSVPGGWSIVAGAGTSTVTVTVGNPSGNVQVTPSNSCGNGTARTLAVTTSTIPAQPSTITGATPVCQNSTQTYSVTNVSGVTYTWSVPTGWTIVAGAGTNSVTVTVGATSGNVQVTPSNPCGNGTARTKAITVNTVPAQPSAITGITAPCQGTTQVYSVTNVTGVTYTWTVPADWTITAGAGTSSITVTVGATAGDVQVTPSNTCGNGTARTQAVTANTVPAQPTAITGNASPCQGSTQTYSVTNVSGVTYTWSVPTGWTVTAGAGTSSVTVTVGSVAGNIQVTPSNGCGNGTANTQAATISTIPAQPSVIAGNTPVCQGSSQTYSVTNVSGVTYAWTVPTGWTITAGSGTSSVTVTAGSAAGNVQVTPSNSCGNGTARTKAVTVNTVPAQPSVITGITTPCQGSSQTYSVTNVAGVIYNWTVPAGWTITAGAGTNTITVTVGSTSGNVQVIPSNTCGNGTARSSTITVTPSVAASVSISASANPICTGNSVTFTSTPVNGGTTPAYQWYVNSAPVGTSNTYTSSSLADNDQVLCVMTSNASCVTGSPATSGTITMSVNANVSPSVSVSASSTIICAGIPVTFTASPINGGTSPTYQWYLDSSPVGTGTGTYTNSSLTDGSQVYCIMTSGLACASPATATSNTTTISVTATVAPSVAVNASETTICSGTSVTFTASPVNGGTTPTYQWYLNSSPVGTGTSSYTNSSLTDGSQVYCIMTSGLGCASPTTATSNTETITVTSTVAPSVSVNASQTSICSGDNVTFTASATNGGTSPTYQWYLNSSPVGTGTSTYSNSSLTTGSQVYCIMTSGLSCASPTTATSNTTTITVTSPVTPSVAISASQTSVCSGTGVTFTASATNGGTSPAYQWYLNSSPVGTGTGTYTNSSLTNGSQVYCIMTSDLACANPVTATSNTSTITVTSTVVPSVSVNASQTSICSGTSVTFTASGINEGTSPVFQWYLNSSPVGTGTSTYTNSSLTDGSQVYCEMTSNIACASPATVSSNTSIITVSSTVAPSVSVNASQTTICTGTNVTFTASPNNGGTTPVYQWYLNSSPIGSNSPSWSTSSLLNNDQVYCVMTSGLACASPLSATSNTIILTVSGTVSPSVTISGTDVSICTGTSVTFTASTVNGGSTPVFQWMVNGNPDGTNSSTYTSSTLADNDQVTCLIYSSLSCANPISATSNILTMTVGQVVTPTVSITASSANICAGSSADFTAVAANEGTSPVYQWYVNGTPAGTNSSVFTSTTLSDGDIVSCTLTSDEPCATLNPAVSNSVAMNVSSSLPVTINISTPDNSVCEGQAVNFTASATNAGTSPDYQWMINGNPVGPNSASFTGVVLSDGDVVSCMVTSSESCATGNPASSNDISITVYPAPPTPTVYQSGDTLYSTATTGNQWYFMTMGVLIPNAVNQYYVPPVDGEFYVIVTDANGCSSDTSNIIYFIYTGVAGNQTDLDFMIFPNPNSGIFYVLMNKPVNGDVKLRIVNVLGQTVAMKNLTGNRTEIDSRFLINGVYYIELTGNNKVVTKMIQIKK